MNKQHGFGNPGNTNNSNCPWTSYWNEHFSDGLNWRELPWGEQRAAGMAAEVVKSLTAGSSPLGPLGCLICNRLFRSDDVEGFQRHMICLEHQNKMTRFDRLKKKLTVYFIHWYKNNCMNIFERSALAVEEMLGNVGLETIPEDKIRKNGCQLFCKLCKSRLSKGDKVSHLLGQRHLKACCKYVGKRSLTLMRSLEQQASAGSGWCGSTVPMLPVQPPPNTYNNPVQLIPIAPWPATAAREPSPPGTSTTTTPALPSSTGNYDVPQTLGYTSPMSDPRLESRKAPNIIWRPPPQQSARPADSAPRSSSPPSSSVPRPASSVRAQAAPPPVNSTVPSNYGNAVPGTSPITTSVLEPRISRVSRWNVPGPVQSSGFYRPQAVQPPPGLRVLAAHEIHTISSQEARPPPLNSTVSTYYGNVAPGTSATPTSVQGPRISRVSRWDVPGPVQSPGFYQPQAVQPPPGLRVLAAHEIRTISSQEVRPTSQNTPEQMSLDSEFSNFFSTTDDGTTPVPPIEKVSSKSTSKLRSSSTLKPFPFLPFDKIIGYNFPSEASEALDLLLDHSQKYQVEKYVQADCHVKGLTFTAIGRTEDEAKNKAAREALKFLQFLQRNAAPLNAKV